MEKKVFRGALALILTTAVLASTVHAQAANNAPADAPAQNKAAIKVDVSTLESANKRLMDAEAQVLQAISTKEVKPDTVKASLKPEPVKKPAAAAKTVQKKAPAAPVAAAQNQPTSISKELAGEMETLHSNNASLKTEVKSQTKSIASLNQDNSALKTQLNSNQRRTEALLAKMQEMRNHLMIAETEISRLSSIIEDRNRTTLARYSGAAAAPAKTEAGYQPQKATLLTDAQETKATEDMPIATVMVDNANLRSGPGKNNSPMMSISKGTRLAIEARQGDWYRVVAPNGSRAWIDAEIVAFGKNLQSTPTRTVKVGGYDSSVEKQAFEFIRDRQ